MTTVDGERPEVLLLLGIMKRSGTNFLFDVLSQHPRCAPIRRIWEDKILTQAHLLDEYVELVSSAWAQHWDPDGAAASELRGYLASACLDWISSLPKPSDLVGARYVVTKSPTVVNLDRLPLFERARAIVIVRDGRAVVESSMRSFGDDFERTARNWAEAARTILRQKGQEAPFLLVRYEELVSDLEATVVNVLDHLGLSRNEYDFEAARNLPVRGSSSFGTHEDGKPNWLPTEKDDSFRPLDRFAGWTAEQHRVFNRIAGDELTRLGYEVASGGE
jgi:hypothetical protein